MMIYIYSTLRCLGPGFTVLALGPGFTPIFIHSFIHEERYSNYLGICPKTAPSNNNNNNRRLVTLAPSNGYGFRGSGFANILTGPVYPDQFVIKIISTFIFTRTNLISITSQGSEWGLGK